MAITNTLNGFAAECKAQSLLKAAKCTRVEFTTYQILSVLSQTHLGQQRLDQAERYLLLEYGTEYSDGEVQLDFNSVPADVLLDYVLACDLAICYKGWKFAIDITTDVEAVDQKVRKGKKLLPILKQLDFDFHLTIYMEDRFTSQDLKDALDGVIKMGRETKIRATSVTLP